MRLALGRVPRFPLIATTNESRMEVIKKDIHFGRLYVDVTVVEVTPTKLLMSDGAEIPRDVFVAQGRYAGKYERGRATSTGRAIPVAKKVEEIRAWYRQESLRLHPDRGGNALEFRQMQAVYEQKMKEAVTK